MIVRFNKEDRSTFPYWFAHWCAFNMVALNLKCWKFKYLFHDIEKPWLLLWYKYIMNYDDAYKHVQKWHRKHNKHHIEYYPKANRDFAAMLIDWECSQFTKTTSPLNAVEELEQQLQNGKITVIEYNIIKKYAIDMGLNYKKENDN